LISGAGIAGCTLAYILEQRGIQSTVIEKSPALRKEGYMVDFFGSGYDAAEKLSLLPDLQAIHYGIAQLAFFGGEGNCRFSIPYDAVRKLFDGRHFNFMRGDLERVLYSKLGNSVDVRFGVEIDAIDYRETGCSAVLSDGARIDCDLLVGADGIHSKVRELCFGEESQFLRYLSCNTAAFVIDNPPATLRVGNMFSTLTVPGKQVAIYPIRGGKLATFFVHSSEGPPSQLSPSAAAAELHALYKDMGWIVPELLENINQSTIYFDVVSQVEMPAWSKSQVVLVGDAAYCVSLIAGQGASLAMAGAFILAEELSRAHGEIRSALASYEQRLRQAIEKKQAAGRSMVKWFVPASSARLAIRDTVMRLTTVGLAQPLLKRFFATESVFKRAS
jgi:2-polyprenyl-6-methoxyphenol hydroxylase-like FAD-dependent oxidoreductase